MGSGLHFPAGSLHAGRSVGRRQPLTSSETLNPGCRTISVPIAARYADLAAERARQLGVGKAVRTVLPGGAAPKASGGGNTVPQLLAAGNPYVMLDVPHLQMSFV